jgi:hypothetical protein
MAAGRNVVHIDFAEWTSGDHLRHPKYARLRDDKDPRKVVKVTLQICCRANCHMSGAHAPNANTPSICRSASEAGMRSDAVAPESSTTWSLTGGLPLPLSITAIGLTNHRPHGDRVTGISLTKMWCAAVRCVTLALRGISSGGYPTCGH